MVIISDTKFTTNFQDFGFENQLRFEISKTDFKEVVQDFETPWLHTRDSPWPVMVPIRSQRLTDFALFLAWLCLTNTHKLSESK